MYKFEISADSPKELNEKMLDFAKEIIGDTHIPKQPELPQYLDEVVELPPFEFPTTQMVAPPTPVNIPAIPAAVPTITSSIAERAVARDRDSRGFVWDARIHSSARSFNKDGSWRALRGVDDALVAQVENELRNGGPSPAIFSAPPPPVATIPVEVPSIIQKQAELPPRAEPLITPKYENIPVPQGLKPAHSLTTFKNNLMILIAQLINENKINHEWVEQVKKHFGVKEVWNILADGKQCEELFETFVKYGFITEIEG